MNEENVPLNFIDALEAENVPYMLVGSFSSNYYGIPRSTHDADFVIQLGDTRIADIARHLHDDLRLDPQVSFETVTGTVKNVFEMRPTGFKVELFRLSEDPHDQERFRRRVLQKLFQRDVYLPTAEDVVITKLRWYRPKDREDVENVLNVRRDLDFDYIHHWCEQHNTRAMLDEIRDSLPPPDDSE